MCAYVYNISGGGRSAIFRHPLLAIIARSTYMAHHLPICIYLIICGVSAVPVQWYNNSIRIFTYYAGWSRLSADRYRRFCLDAGAGMHELQICEWQRAEHKNRLTMPACGLHHHHYHHTYLWPCAAGRTRTHRTTCTTCHWSRKRASGRACAWSSPGTGSACDSGRGASGTDLRVCRVPRDKWAKNGKTWEQCLNTCLKRIYPLTLLLLNNQHAIVWGLMEQRKRISLI